MFPNFPLPYVQRSNKHLLFKIMPFSAQTMRFPHALYFHSSACSHKLVVIRILKITKVGQGESPCDLQTYLLTFPTEYKTTMTLMSFSTLHLCGFFSFGVVPPPPVTLSLNSIWSPLQKWKNISSLSALIKIHVGCCLESEQPRHWTQLSMEIPTAAWQPMCCLNHFLTF